MKLFRVDIEKIVEYETNALVIARDSDHACELTEGGIRNCEIEVGDYDPVNENTDIVTIKEEVVITEAILKEIKEYGVYSGKGNCMEYNMDSLHTQMEDALIEKKLKDNHREFDFE